MIKLVITTMSLTKVGVKSQRLNRKSLTSITVVCHEIGHAIQDAEDYKPLRRRHSIIQKLDGFQKLEIY